jgi:putative ABC transport system ATP-binding protein
MDFRGVALAYPGPPPVRALDPCQLVIGRGQHVALVGPSGSGKSTWLNVAGLLDRPTAGMYLLDGTDTGVLSERDRTTLRAERIGFVFQAFHLLPHRTALENVALALLYRGIQRRARRQVALDALERVGLAARSHAPPAQLSGGERQRVAIARALAVRPSILLCDEPTGNLDTASAGTILQLVDDLHAEGQTVVVVTHDPQVACRAERWSLFAMGSSARPTGEAADPARAADGGPV